MSDTNLIWKEERSSKVFDCKIFSVRESRCVSPDNEPRTYTVIDAADWAIIVPVIDESQGRRFVMVRQWRHGSRSLSLEELENTGKQALDDDEYVEVVLADVDEVCKGMGRPPYIHALMGAALSLYLQNR